MSRNGRSRRLRNHFLAVAVLGVAACQTTGSGSYTTSGKDIGEGKCRDVALANSRLYIGPMIDAYGQPPSTLKRCSHGDRDREGATWKNGGSLTYTVAYGGFFGIAPREFRAILGKHFDAEIPESALVLRDGRHNNLWYYRHDLGSRTCLYFNTFTETWSATGPEGFAQGAFIGVHCFAADADFDAQVALIRSVGLK